MEIFIDAPNLLKAYDYALLLTCPMVNGGHEAFMAETASVLKSIDRSFLVVLVGEHTDEQFKSSAKKWFADNSSVAVQFVPLNSMRNQQLALLSGLSYISNTKCKHCIVMHADGNDDPQVIRELIDVTGKDVVFVNKGPKANNPLFWLVYRFHQFFFWLLTNRQLEVDHFSMINRRAMSSLLESPFRHYATALHLRNLSAKQIRYEHPVHSLRQECEMLFKNSIASLMEFGERLLNVFLRFSLTMGFLFFAGLIYVGFTKFSGQGTLPEWMPITLICLFSGTLLNIGFFALGVTLLNQQQVHLQPYQRSHREQVYVTTSGLDN